MKQSIAPADFILLHAGTNSLFDRCHFALIHVTQEWLQEIHRRYAMAMQFEHDEHFHHLRFSGAPLGFFFWPSETFHWQTTNLDLLPKP